MNFLTFLFNPILDFVFPKSKAREFLESLSASEMLNQFPSASNLPDDRSLALFDYKDPAVRDLVWEIKYSANRKLAKSASELIYDLICHELAERALFENFTHPLLLPMPMSSKKLREKGFNQTEIICEEIKKLDKENLLEYLPNILIKIRHTESQTKTLNKKNRLENLNNSMAIRDKLKLQNRSVVLIDDVITTGASVLEARRALKQGGAKKILAIALAH